MLVKGFQLLVGNQIRLALLNRAEILLVYLNQELCCEVEATKWPIAMISRIKHFNINKF